MMIDISDRKKAELALRESEERYRTLVETMNEGLALTDENYVFTFVNLRFPEMLGYDREEVIGRQILDLVHDDYQDFMKDQIARRKRGEETSYEIAWKAKDGSKVFTLISPRALKDDKGRFVGSVGVLTDISARKKAEEEIKKAHEEKGKLEEQLIQARKMEAVGTLAGGIAHDFNNLLMGIQGNASLMLLDVNDMHPYYERLKNIEKYIQNGTELTKQLLGFARGGKYEVRPTDMNDLLRQSSRMFGRTRKEIGIHIKYQQDIWPVEVDHGQMEQALLNLYVNAWQAMPDGGDLYLQTQNVLLNENFVKPYEVQPGKYVKISITDTGVGMKKETRLRVFEPFFSTKDRGRGTGLGLASVYGIVKNHGGLVGVESEEGKGATFEIYLPASEKKTPKTSNVSQEIIKGTGTVLLVDDEEMILDVGKDILDALGYKVLTAGSGKGAVEIFKRARDQIDLIILDIIMPNMGGAETYDLLRAIDPQVKVLLSSGYSIDGKATEIINRGCNGFIQKPFTLKELSKKIRDVLAVV